MEIVSATNLERRPVPTPSAEDLDAAQQFISSARGMRPILAFSNQDRLPMNGGEDWQTANKPKMSDAMDMTPDRTSEAGDTSRHTSMGQHQSPKPAGGRDTAFLGHSCR